MSADSSRIGRSIRRSGSEISRILRRSFGSGSRVVSCGRKIYGPESLGLEDDKIQDDREEDEEGEIVSELLAKIQSCYQRVKHKGVFDNGFCFGLLDPVSNIVAGIFIAREVKVDPGDTASFPRLREPDLIGDMNQRSLIGLVAFLVALFPSLTNTKAIWYLNKAELDPLVAARLIIKHRGMERSFGFASDTTVEAVETALRCAAAAAQHPNPLKFALGWKLISPFLNKVATLLSGPYANSSDISLIPMIPIVRQDPQPSVFSLDISWDLASSRLVKLSPDLFSGNKVQVYPKRSTMRRMLLTTIHGYYLQALAMLPKDMLRSHYHRSMLQAGHCYGPLDPVSNIIINTIWYSGAFPRKKEVEIEAISTRGLLRIAVRSFYGLVSFLCTRWGLTPDEAMQRLQADGAKLGIADRTNLLDDGKNDDAMASASLREAYAAAAIAARHPVPCHQVSLLIPCNPLLLMASDYLKDGGMLSREVAGKLHDALVYSSKIDQSEQQQQQKETKLNHWVYASVNKKIKNFWSQHARVLRMVKSAIDQMALFSRDKTSVSSSGVPKYELHAICGVNECVDTTPSTGTYGCSHINFLATKSASTPPTLFFAEFRGTKVGLCCPVNVPPPGAEQVRCLYCEFHGSRIVHPARESFRGRDIEFEKMLCGEGLYSGWHTNDDIINRSHKVTYWVDDLEDDWIYRDYSLDDKVEGVDEFLDNQLQYTEIR